MNDGTQYSVRIPAPTPLSFICKVVDGEIRLTGIAQPDDEVVIMVSDSENILFTDSVTADSQGGFSDNFVLESDIPINSDTLLIIINTASNIGAEQEFIYTGSLPVHIDEGSGGYLIFTNYTRREIKDGSVVAAVYDGERLIDCYSFKIDIGAEETVEKLIERVQDGYRMKIYLWDSLSGARPLARALEM